VFTFQKHNADGHSAVPYYIDTFINLHRLSGVSTSAIAKGIGVSHWYASKICQGYRPHPRHWEALAQLVGVESSSW